jgi:hypothetical protein
MSNTISYSSELMQNYLQASIMDPQDRFEALQDGNGNAMLFSTGTNGVFYLTQETPGTASGWTQTDLSTAALTGNLTGGTCKSFCAAQNPADGTIGLAMIISVNKTDTLLLCMGNSNTNLAWVQSPSWTTYAYDNTSVTAPSPLTIANVFISETNSGQYIVADLDINNLVSRFYINTNAAAPEHWNVAPLNMDLDAGSSYQSVIGRIASGGLDGMYSAGTINGDAQLEYMPLYNEFGSNPPTPTPMSLPGNIAAQSIAAFRNGNSDDSTDLLIAATDASGNGGLYYIASTSQVSGATAQLLIQDPLLVNVSQLDAYLSDGTITVWGLNGADQVFYLTCPYTPDTPGTCNAPMLVLANVDMMSPYINLSNGGNTIFAVGGNELYIVTRSPQTTLWSKSQVMLPPPASNSPALQFSSYTTQIIITDANNKPVPNYQLMVSASTRATFYINYLYYVLDTTPVPISTDLGGNINIIEMVNDLTGTRIIVQDGTETPITINPMDSAIQRAVQLNTPASLQAAVIPGTNTPLVAPGTTTQQLQTVATANTDLAQAYTGITAPGGSSATLAAARTRPVTDVLGSSDGILSDIGDLFNMLESGIDAIVNVVKDALSDAWHFIVSIGEKVYRAVIDTVEAVAGAIKWVFNQIVKAIEDLVKFLEFLFEIGDMTNTKNVLKNAINLLIQKQVSEIQDAVNAFDGAVTEVETKIDTLAGLPAGWAAQYNNSLQSSSAAQTPHAPGHMLAYHMQHNASNATWTPLGTPSGDLLQQLITTFFTALNNEGEILDTAITQMKAIFENAYSLTLEQLIMQVMAVFADGLISSVANVLNAVAAVLIELITTALGDLNQPAYIPVVSDILSFFGISTPSWMDIICWVMAIPATIIYKLASGSAPFPSGTLTSELTSATSFDTFIGYLAGTSAGTQSAPPHAAAEMMMATTAPPAAAAPGAAASILPSPTSLPLNGSQQLGFLLLQLTSSIASFILAPVDVLEAGSEDSSNAFTYPSILLAIVCGAGAGIADIVAPVYPIKDSVVNDVKLASNALRLIGKIVFSSFGQALFASGKVPKLSFLKVDDGRAVGAVYDAVLVIPALFCSCWHFYELSQDTSGDSRSLAIIDETSNMVAYVGRVSYAVAVNAQGTVPGDIALVALGASDVIYGALHVAEYELAKS